MPTGETSTLWLRGRVRNIVKCLFEDWLELEARRRVLRQKGGLDEQEYAESFASMTKEIGAGTFSWGGEGWHKSISMLPGVVKLATLLANDAVKLAKKAGATQGIMREGDILALIRDPLLQVVNADGMRTNLVTLAVKQIGESSPDFLDPPIRGMSEGD